MVGGEHSLKISAPQLLRFGIDSVLKILNERMTFNESINEIINHKAVYRTAPATLGLLLLLLFVYYVFLNYLSEGRKVLELTRALAGSSKNPNSQRKTEVVVSYVQLKDAT